ncbi:hypothetical protein [Leifsonia sp. Leaf264]|uniref:hypothetical protein n=1 Tax=Leifsonia sp. Leaf264 TaxID=1736314 RepID=UPI0006F9A1DD|nr:hypothetical protein [Leifsonia sp. Leaf264]KQO98304.1 hypothetical protein ASF30_09600 [Leifsonia sp. Leaf264]
MSDPRTTPAHQKTSSYHPTGGWNEKRTHSDGHSYWRDGKLHREDGYAVDRRSNRQVWIGGKLIPAPETKQDVRLTFTGVTKAGYLHWEDQDGMIRVRAHLNARNAYEMRYFDVEGEPEPHWAGGYTLVVHYDDGERRYFRQDYDHGVPKLHRLDGPAIQLPVTTRNHAAKSKWLEDGQRVDGPVELFIRHRMKMKAQPDDWSPPVITDREAARLRAVVIADPESPIALDVAFTYSNEYSEAICHIDGLPAPQHHSVADEAAAWLAALTGEDDDDTAGDEFITGPDDTDETGN